MNQFALTKEDSTTIGFVVSSIFAGAIDTRELQAWADHVLATSESYPPYIVDLSTFDEALCHIFRVIGFTPHSPLTETEEVALVGIAFLRGRDQFEPEPTREHALAAIATHPRVIADFCQTFPFLKFEYDRNA